MVTKTVNLQEKPTSVEELLSLLDEDENTELLLIKDDRLVARLSSVKSAPSSPKPRIPGLHAGTTWVSDDFDEPLPDEFWLGET
jgi:hypothetical protein